MKLLSLVAGELLGACFTPLRDPMIRFLGKQIDILLRVLADHGVDRIICTPDERLALLAIGADLDHKVKGVFRINTWATYRTWLRQAKEGREPGRPGRPPRFTAEVVALVVRIARENLLFGLGKIAGELKKLGIVMSTGTVRAILRKHGITPPDDGKVSSFRVSSFRAQRNTLSKTVLRSHVPPCRSFLKSSP